MEEYPSNSYKLREASLVRNAPAEARPEIKPVSEPIKTPEEKTTPKTEGLVRTRKVSTAKQIFAALFPEGLSGVKEHLIWDVLVPRLGEILHSGWDDVGDVIFSGGNQRPQRRNYTSYSSYSGNRRHPVEMPDRYDRYKYEEPVYGTREEANAVLRGFKNYIERYGVLRLLEYNEEMGFQTNPGHANYGWINLDAARIERTYDRKWVIVMPRPLQID